MDETTKSEPVVPAVGIPVERGLGAWLPIETAPMAVLVLLAVVDAAGERRVFVAETSHEGGKWHWLSTVSWTGWGRLHTAWRPTHWRPLPAPPPEKTMSQKMREAGYTSRPTWRSLPSDE